MTREQKVQKINELLEVMGVMFLTNPIIVRGTSCDLINADGVMEDICGDWCVVALFDGEIKDEDGNVIVPRMTDAEVDTVFTAVKNEARNILVNTARNLQ